MQMQLVPRNISEDEPCVRCVMHPMMFSESKQRLKKEAVLPAPQKKDVSLLRLNYTNLKFCIFHGKKLSNNNAVFKCLATLYAKHLLELNELTDSKNVQWAGIKAEIKYGPMHKGKYVLDKDVYVEDPSVELPMHADLTYNVINEGNVSTRMRRYASQLVKKMEVIYKENTNVKI